MFCWVNVVIFSCLYVDDTVIYTNNKTNHLNQIVLSSKKYIVALKDTLLFHRALLFHTIWRTYQHGNIMLQVKSSSTLRI